MNPIIKLWPCIRVDFVTRNLTVRNPKSFPFYIELILLLRSTQFCLFNFSFFMYVLKQPLSCNWKQQLLPCQWEKQVGPHFHAHNFKLLQKIFSYLLQDVRLILVQYDRFRFEKRNLKYSVGFFLNLMNPSGVCGNRFPGKGPSIKDIRFLDR